MEKCFITSHSIASVKQSLMPLEIFTEAIKPVWKPSSAIRKPVPKRQVHVEVWGIGAFKFKGIAGQSKVRPALFLCLRPLPYGYSYAMHT